MNFALNLTLLLIFFCVFTIEAQKYDSLDVDKILSNDRLLDSYIKCVLDKGPCTTEGKSLKDDIPMALKDNCAKCTLKEKTTVRKVVKFVMKNKSKEWEAIKQHYDPSGTYKDSFNKFINAED